jgi:hypothetical protein
MNKTFGGAFHFLKGTWVIMLYNTFSKYIKKNSSCCVVVDKTFWHCALC